MAAADLYSDSSNEGVDGLDGEWKIQCENSTIVIVFAAADIPSIAGPFTQEHFSSIPNT